MQTPRSPAVNAAVAAAATPTAAQNTRIATVGQIAATRNAINGDLAPINSTLTNAAASTSLPATISTPIATLLQQTRNYLRQVHDGILIDGNVSIDTLVVPGLYRCGQSHSRAGFPSDYEWAHLNLASTPMRECTIRVEFSMGTSRIRQRLTARGGDGSLRWTRGDTSSGFHPWVRLPALNDILTVSGLQIINGHPTAIVANLSNPNERSMPVGSYIIVKNQTTEVFSVNAELPFYDSANRWGGLINCGCVCAYKDGGAPDSGILNGIWRSCGEMNGFIMARRVA